MRVRALVAGAAVLALAGCSVRGTVDIGTDKAHVDLTVSHAASLLSGPCRLGGLPWGLKASDAVESGGEVTCRLVGTPTGRDADWLVTRAAGHAVLVWRVPTYTAEDGSAVTDLDVAVTFPGRVVSVVGGTASGGTVRFTRADTTVAAVGETTPHAPDLWPLNAFAIGAGLGAAGTWLAGRLRRRPDAVVPAPPGKP